MPKPKINFFNEEIDHFLLKQKQKHKNWLIAIAHREGFTISQLNYIFASDEYVLKINQDFLHHDTYTDVITFDTASDRKNIAGEIYISIVRVKENAQRLKTDFEEELHRVMAHGLLHLCGNGDKTDAEIKIMREKEEEAIGEFVNA